MRLTAAVLSAAVALATGCGGGDETGPSTTFENVAGNYSGAMAGVSQGIALDGNFSIQLQQTAGTLSGSYGITATLTDGVSSVNVAGTGTITGTIQAGNNPSVNLTVKTGACPNYQASFTGAYDSANHRITLTGPVEFFAVNSCSVALTYQTTFILTR